jgi:biopolymer transport protein ExbB/TolQ
VELWLVVIEWMARLILVLLIGLSVWSLAIIIDRRSYFKNLDPDKEFDKLKDKLKNLKAENVDKGTSRFLFHQQNEQQKGLAVLGSLGSTTPFIGLLGTIMGIIVAFGELSKGSSGSNAIMFALAEALILTAVGLFVAIPAVIAFNYFNKKIKYLKNDQQSRLDEYISLGKL